MAKEVDFFNKMDAHQLMVQRVKVCPWNSTIPSSCEKHLDMQTKAEKNKP